MAEVVKVKLDEVLVDQRRFSARRKPIDEEYIAELRSALEDGEGLPPLKVVRPVSPADAWCGVANIHQKSVAAKLHAEQLANPWANLPSLPEFVLYDGLSVYWALRQADIREWDAVVHPQRVDNAQAVLALFADANRRHGRRLDDGDQFDLFCRLWLGRAVRPKKETWQASPEGLSGIELAGIFHRSEAWVSKRKSWVQVEHACADAEAPLQVLLGQSKCLAIATLPEAAWRPFVWEADHPRFYLPLDDLMQPVADRGLLTIAEMTCRDVERLVKRARNQIELDADGPLPGGGTTNPLADQPTLPDERTWFQGELPLDFDEPRERVRTIRGVVQDLDDNRLRETGIAYRPFYIDTALTWEELQREAKRRGVEFG